jgi:plastocyanin
MRYGIGVFLACLALPACFSDRPATGPEPPAGSGSDVSISNFAYVPPSLSVRTGTVVTWTNADDVGHTVSSDDGTAFESGVIGSNATFQFTAGAPGTYGYFCRIHPFMKATLTVTP